MQLKGDCSKDSDHFGELDDPWVNTLTKGLGCATQEEFGGDDCMTYANLMLIDGRQEFQAILGSFTK